MAGLQRHLHGAMAGFAWRRLVVAFSGGPDSTVLLHLALAAVGRGANSPLSATPSPQPSEPADLGGAPSPSEEAAAQVPVAALHVNHGLHPQADLWQAHCARLCAGLGVQFLCRKVQVAGGNVEAMARQARYRAFNELLAPGDLLLLAHHRQDQTETLLLRLLQGRGFAAMPRSRRLDCGALLLRPLLNVPRRQILDALAALGVPSIEDPSNADPALDRGFLRRRILPALTQRWPGAAKALAAAGAAQAVKDDLLSRLLDRETLALGEFPAQFQVPALQAWLARFGEQGASNRALAEFAAQLGARADAQPELRLRQGSLRRWKGAVCYAPAAPPLQRRYPLRPPCTLALPHGDLSVQRVQEGGFQADGDRLEVRFRRGGERIRSRGHARSLKAIFQAAAVPPWQRDTYPLVFCGEELCAVPGLAAAEGKVARPGWRAAWRPRALSRFA